MTQEYPTHPDKTLFPQLLCPTFRESESLTGLASTGHMQRSKQQTERSAHVECEQTFTGYR